MGGQEGRVGWSGGQFTRSVDILSKGPWEAGVLPEAEYRRRSLRSSGTRGTSGTVRDRRSGGRASKGEARRFPGERAGQGGVLGA